MAVESEAVCVYLFGSRVNSEGELGAWPIGKAALEQGFKVGSGADYSSVWCFDFTWKALYRLLKVPRNRRYLFVFEPRAVLPSQHRGFVQDLFGHVLVFSQGQRNERAHFVEGGGAFLTRRRYVPREPLYDVVMANANKQSAVGGSLYHLRASALVAAAKSGRTVGLAGTGWKDYSDIPKKLLVSITTALMALEIPVIHFSQVRQGRLLRKLDKVAILGEVEDLYEFYSQGRVALVIENDPAFLSEKLFNAIASAPAVVYVGPEEALGYSIPGVYFAGPEVESVVKALNDALIGPTISPQMANRVLRYRSQDDFASRLVTKIQAISSCESDSL